MQKLLTTGEIAKKLNVPWYKVGYCLKRHEIKPTEIFGGRQLFDKEKVKLFAEKLVKKPEAK
ncbi:MAG: hypothetical protein ACUZ8H_04740 [Candidatus Anammoxibacter sp.]